MTDIYINQGKTVDKQHYNTNIIKYIKGGRPLRGAAFAKGGIGEDIYWNYGMKFLRIGELGRSFTAYLVHGCHKGAGMKVSLYTFADLLPLSAFSASLFKFGALYAALLPCT